MTSEAQTEMKKPSRRRGCAIVIWCAILMIGIGAGAYWITAHARTRMLGTTDPATGLHFEFSVSAQFRSSPANAPPADALGAWDFDPRPVPPPVAWFRRVILHQKVQPALSGLHTITAGTMRRGPKDGITIDPQGYPLFDTSGMRLKTRVERMIIAGCPSTRTEVDLSPLAPTVGTIYLIVVHPAGTNLIFACDGHAQDGLSDEDIRREMSHIRDSIKIVRSK